MFHKHIHTHIGFDYWSCFRCGFYLFMFLGRICNIRTFHLASEVSRLISIQFRPIHITSTRFSYIWQGFLYFTCTRGFYAICGIICYKGVSRGFQHHSQPPYVCTYKCSLCDAFILLCPTLVLFITYHISIFKYLIALH